MIKLLKIVCATFLGTISLSFGQMDRSWSMSDEEIDRKYGNAAIDRGAKSQRDSLAEIVKDIEGYRKKPESEAIPYLGKILVKLSKSNIFQVPERIGVYDFAQVTALSIPGHAKYFADELERVRPKDLTKYEKLRTQYLAETLQHLPSPETVQVLGHYLDDMRDTPFDENPKYDEMVRSGKFKPLDWTPLPQNAWLATYALSNIGLRDPPYAALTDYSLLRFSTSKDALAKFRKWWLQVKAGEIPFSFVGQSVEYRFQPDGSVAISTPAEIPEEKPNQKEDAAKEEGERILETPEEPYVADTKSTPAPPSPWVWIAAAAALSGAAVGFFKMRKR